MRGDTNDPNGWGEARVTRLLEGPSDTFDDDATWALDLLREAPAHRLRPGERQRVLFGLRRPHANARHVWFVRIATAAAALVAATTIAWAGLGGLPRWLTGLSHSQSDNAAPCVHAVPEAVRRRVPTPPAPMAAPPLEAVPTSFGAPSGNPVHPSRHHLASTTEDLDSDSGLVVQAMRALRRDANPALARGLCAAYLDRHPNGALAEEALALTVEAAVAHHDMDAPALGAHYLRSYPNGPFRGLARQASRATPATLQ